MHRIKKLFILQLAVILVFSIITVISSADANIPQGPKMCIRDREKH